MRRRTIVRRARPCSHHFKWLRESFFPVPPSTPNEEELFGLLCDFDRMLAAILRAATQGDWTTVDRLDAVLNEGHRDFVRDVIRPGLRRLAEEN